MGFVVIDSFLQMMCNKIGMPFNLVNIFLCLLSTFPLGLLNRNFKNVQLRLIYGLLTGVVLQFQMFGISMLHLVIATINTYLFIKFLGRKHSAFYVMAFNILHLSFIHINNMLSNYGNWYLGVETLYMMSICKFSSVAFNYEDGGNKESEIKSSYHRSKMVKEKPSFLEISSFIFYYPSSLIGPSFEFSDFMRFIKLEKEFQNINWKGVNRASFIQFIHGIIAAVVLVVLSKKYTTQYCGTEEFENRSMLFKFLYFNFSIALLRSRYYVGWKLSQASVIFCGLGYDIQKNEKGESVESYDRVENINIKIIETDINPRKIINYWNRTVHLWLKYYLFLRLINVQRKPFHNNKSLVTFVTFMVSAFWHGFYPVYFFFFFEYYMIEQITKYLEEEYDLFNKMEELPFFPKQLFRILIRSIINYFGLCFTLLTIQANFIFSRSFYFIPFMSLFLGYLYVMYLRILKKNKNRLETDRKKIEFNNNGRE